jgi:DNA-binding MarR family transcriptional regulator
MKEESLNRDLWLFHVAFRQLIKLPDELLQARGLGRIHHRILFVIGRSGEISVGAIAEKLAITRQALHGPMRQLRELQLIASAPSPENRTVQLVRLTKAGAALEFDVNELQRRHLALAFAQWGKASEQAWRKVMTTVSQVLPDQN